ncbi:MAG TPA: glycosyltransferase family 39 protein, partial [Tepidisphaeraceae bacterium]|nr:glycosyltransferase family 39 protein [Tepidisphaeraceae bacterium]
MTTAAGTDDHLAHAAPRTDRASATGRLASAAFAAAMFVVAVGGLALRWVSLGRESLWFDEGMTAYLASLTPDEMVRTIAGDVAAPLLFFVMRYWTAWLGGHEVAMRSLSALAATLAVVPFAFLLKRSVTGRLATLAGSALFAASLMQVEYAREARYYALLSLLLAGALAGAVSFVERRSEIGLAAVVGCVVLGLYTHNLTAFYLPGLAVAWLAWPGGRAWWQRALDGLGAAVVVFVLYLPWLPVLQRQMAWMTGTFWAARPDATAAASTLSTLAGVYPYDVPQWAWDVMRWKWSAGPVAAVVAVVLLALVTLSLLTRDAAQRRKAVALAAFALAPVVLVFVASRVGQPVFMDRAFAPCAVVLPVLLAMSVDATRARGLRLAGGVLLLVLALAGTASTVGVITGGRKLVPGEDWRGAYQYVASLDPTPRRLVAFVANEGELPFTYYAEQANPTPAQPTHDRRGRPTERHPPTFGPAAHRGFRRTGVPAGFFDLDPPQTIRRVLSDNDLAPLVSATAGRSVTEVVLILSHDAFADPDGRSEA